MARFRSPLWRAILGGGLFLTAASALADGAPAAIPEAARTKLVGLPIDCQQAYKSMRACMEKTMAAGAPASLRSQRERQLDKALTSWHAMKGNPGLLRTCREIAANPECSE